MKFYAIVFTKTDAPDTPLIDDAWQASTGDLNPAGLSHSLADTLMAPGVERATIVPIDVPDEDVLRRLSTDQPPIQGIVT